MPPRLAPLAAALVAAALAGGGCGSEGPRPSLACRDGAPAVVAALRRAPGPVRMADGTRLSDCVSRATGDADLQEIGAELTAAASTLAARVPASDAAALRLGYLVGATERGAKRTNGIHAELVNRMDNALGIDGAPPARRAAFARGRAAGAAAG